MSAKTKSARQPGRFLRPGRPDSIVSELVKAGRATTDFSVVRELDTINICVPTPLRKTKDPDMSFIVSAVPGDRQATSIPGLLVILESTTYPGTTDELLLPMFEKPGCKAGEDFFLCFSPGARRSRQPELPDP